jgi:hypothetical protein
LGGRGRRHRADQRRTACDGAEESRGCLWCEMVMWSGKKYLHSALDCSKGLGRHRGAQCHRSASLWQCSQNSTDRDEQHQRGQSAHSGADACYAVELTGWAGSVQHRAALFNWAAPVNTFGIFQCFSNLNQKLPVQKYKT